MFSFFSKNTNTAADTGDAYYENDPLLGLKRDLTYQDCQNLFRYWPLGKRMAEALPKFAMSAPRTFSFGDYGSDELIDRYEKTLRDLRVEKITQQTAILARIYGMASIYVASVDVETLDATKALSYDKINNKNISFNVLDPLSMGATLQIDQDPFSPTFQKPVSTKIRGIEVHPSRIRILYNEIPLYLKFNPSTFSFTGQNIYQNCTMLIPTFNRVLIALQRAATKAGSIVRTTKEVAHASGVTFNTQKINNEMIRLMENDGIAAINNGEQLQLFDINNIQQVSEILSKVNESIAMSLSDTPGAILLDKNISSSLSEGSEEMKAILIAVEHFRESMLRPIYDFVDKYALAVAFNKDWLAEYIKQNKDFRGKQVAEAYELIRQNYSYEFGNIYPQTQGEKEQAKGQMLDNLSKLKELGGTTADIEAIINDSDIFNLELALEEPVQEPSQDFEQESSADSTSFKSEESKETKEA